MGMMKADLEDLEAGTKRELQRLASEHSEMQFRIMDRAAGDLNAFYKELQGRAKCAIDERANSYEKRMDRRLTEVSRAVQEAARENADRSALTRFQAELKTWSTMLQARQVVST